MNSSTLSDVTFLVEGISRTTSTFLFAIRLHFKLHFCWGPGAFQGAGSTHTVLHSLLPPMPSVQCLMEAIGYVLRLVLL